MKWLEAFLSSPPIHDIPRATVHGVVEFTLLLLGFIVTLTAIPCDALVAVLAGKAADLLRRKPTFQRLQNWISGSVLVALGATIALRRD